MNTASASSTAVVSGIRWSAVGQAAGQGIRFGVSVVLARLLAPEDFGLLGMASIVTGFVGIFHSLGTTGTIIQKKDLSSELLSGLFIINVVMGLLLTGSLALSAPFVAMLYGTTRVASIIQVLGLTFLISSLGLVHRSLLHREMCFNRLVQIELTTAVIQGTVAIYLAYIGWKVWALVAGNVLSVSVSTGLLYWMSPWRFHWGFRWSEVKNAMHFGLNLTGAHIVDYVFRNTDKFIIGRFLGATALGYYSMAHSLYMVPRESITGILNRVLFPAFARIQDDDAQLRNGLLRAIGAISLLTFPLMTGMGIMASPFVLGCLGEKWRAIIPLIMIFSPTGMLLSVAATTGQVYLAKGRSDWLLWWNLGAGSSIIVSFFCGLPWGIVGVASAYAIVMVPLTYLSCLLAFRLINLSIKALLATLRPYACASVVMAGLVLCCRLALEAKGFEPLVVLAICVPIGGCLYAAVILLQRPVALEDVLRVLPGGLHRFKCWEVTVEKPRPSGDVAYLHPVEESRFALSLRSPESGEQPKG